MPDKKVITPVQEYQDVKENGLVLPFSLVPKFVRRYFVDNIFTRTFAQLLGWTGSKNVFLACTDSGYLKVSSTGTVNEHNKTLAGNAPDVYGAAVDLARLVPTVDIYTFDFACTIKRSLDDVTYDDEIEIPANYFYSFDCDTRYIKIKNKVALSVCRYQIIGWY
jgi:hypothetical protein